MSYPIQKHQGRIPARATRWISFDNDPPLRCEVERVKAALGRMAEVAQVPTA